MAKRNIKQFGSDLRQIQDELKQFIQTDLPRIVGTEAVNFYKESFDKEGFTDKKKEKWKPRKKETPDHTLGH